MRVQLDLSHAPRFILLNMSRCCPWILFWCCGVLLVLLGVHPGLGQSPPKGTTKSTLEDSLNQHYQAARTFSVVGDTEHASAEYRAFLGEALHRMANAHIKEGNYAAGYRLFAEAIAVAPDDLQLRLDYGNALLQQDNTDQAKIQAQKAVELQPQNSKAEYLLGRVFFDQGDYKAAREHLENAVKAMGGDVTFEVGYDLATVYLKLNDVNRASLLFDEMMIAFGNSAQLHVYFGHAYLMTGVYDRAISEFKEALRKNPKIKEAHYFLGLAYLSKDEDNGWDENAAEDRAEIQNNPNDFRPHFDLGNIDLKRHVPDEAERELKRASEIQPDNPDPLIGLGELLVAQRRTAEAAEVMARAIALTKDVSHNGYQVSRAYYVLGRVQMETGRSDEGAKNLKASAELREKSQAPQQSRDEAAAVAQQRRASEQPLRAEAATSTLSPEEQGQLDTYFAQLKPAIADAYNNLGVAAGAHNNFSEAFADFRKAGAWYPALETLDRNIGMAAFHTGNYQEAVSPLYRVIERNPSDDRARMALGLSYFSQENYKATLETLRPIQQLE